LFYIYYLFSYTVFVGLTLHTRDLICCVKAMLKKKKKNTHGAGMVNDRAAAPATVGATVVLVVVEELWKLSLSFISV
jgi:hypothetical protein